MTNLKRLSLVIAGSAVLLLCAPDQAFARGGGGRGASRTGPAGSGSLGRSRTRASGRGDLIRDGETGGSQHRTSADSRREKEAARDRKKADKAAEKAAKEAAKKRPSWRRRRGGRVYSVAEFEDLSCGRVERVDGASYFFCDGAWFEKVFEGGEVRWVEVEKPE